MTSLGIEAFHRRPLTADEWEGLAEDDEGELVDGWLEEEEMPGALHEAVAGWLYRALFAWVAARGGYAFPSDLKLRVSATRGRKADVSVYLPGRRLPGKDRRAASAPPSIVVEVVSPTPSDARRDLVDKVRDYGAFGVPYYWIVDPRTRIVEVLELGADGRYAVALRAASGAPSVPGCDGLVLDLDALWAEVDRLPDEDE